MDASRRAGWQTASPYLDTALDLPPEARAAWLADLRSRTPDLADLVEAWLAECAALDAESFLEDAPAIEPARTALAGLMVGPYRLVALIGHGGMGSVWTAERADGRFEGLVAVKLLSAALVGRGGEARFAQEGRILARLTHPQIAHLIDAGTTAVGQPYLVLEYVLGEPLDAYCRRHALDVDARVRLFVDVLAPVAHAHANLVVHRDLKPSNVLVDEAGRIKPLDFGIARLLDDAPAGAPQVTRDGDSVLTPAYAAPEQVQRRPVTTGTDVYALGVLLYVILTDRHPFAAALDDPAALLQAIVDTDPPRMSAVTAAPRSRRLAGDLDTIVARAMKKNPAERYASVTALADDLRRFLAHEPVSARPDTWRYRANRFVARHRGAVVASLLALAAIAAGLVGTIVQARRANLESQHARQEAATAREERDRVLEAQRLQRGTTEFLQLMMRDAASSSPGALRRQLDRTSELLDTASFEVPLVKIALLRQTSARYTEIGAHRQALALLRKAQALVQGPELAGPTSAVPVNLACSAARAASGLGDLAAARAELDAADHHLAAGAELSVPSRVECRLIRGLLELAEGRSAAGLGTIQAAMAALETSGTTSGEQHRVMRSAVARALLSVGRTGEALAVIAPLVKESEAGQGRRSMAVVRRSMFMTDVLRAGGRPGEAWVLAQLDAPATAAALGAGQRDAEVALERGRVLLALGRDDEAADELEAVVAGDRAAGGTLILPAAELAAADALLRAGRVARAEALLAGSATVGRGAALAQRAEAAEAHRVLALLAARRGQHARARQELDAAQRIVEANGGATHPAAYAVAMARAGRLLDAHDASAALAACDAALAVARAWALDAEHSSDIGEALALRARIHAALGHAVERTADERAAAAHLESSRRIPVRTTAGDASAAGASGR